MNILRLIANFNNYFESNLLCLLCLYLRSCSKEAKRMQCDCFLTKEELQRGEKGCGEDCLNRLLMIEWFVFYSLLLLKFECIS